MEKEKFYITTAIPYVNAKPHIGHALEFVQADAIARHHQLQGEETALLSGSDDNALKNVQAAETASMEVQQFIDGNAALFAELAQQLNVHFDIFQRGSDRVHHYPSSQKLWKQCAASGDIYKKSYEGLYCLGCETFYTSDELNEQGECFEHPGRKLELVAEENYFFRLSKYQDALIELISSEKLRILPGSRRNEILSFLKQPLQDISISRTNARAKNWGVPVPGDDTQRMYVWFDALNIYQSGVGFGWDEHQYEKYWPADVHVIGKGITRFHAVYWPAFLLSAKLSLPRSLFVHGYITVDGQKMSKTLGNGIDPFEVVKKYGTDPVRYYLLREIPSGEDGDFSYEKFEARYNGDLANGLGNLVARVSTLGEKISPIPFDSQTRESRRAEQRISEIVEKSMEIHKFYKEAIQNFRLNEALSHAWALINLIDLYMSTEEPWKLDEGGKRRVIGFACSWIHEFTSLIEPFLPETAQKIRGQIIVSDSEINVKKAGNLFPRLV